MGSIGRGRSASEEAPFEPSQPAPSTSALGQPPPPIKSRRGRKQNDNLPPSRSRDVQRAFRARRAERLAWLEARVVELEAENAELRARLGIIGDPSQQGQSLPQSSMPRSSVNGHSPAPLPLPLPALPRPGVAASSGWLPPAPMYMTHMHPQQGAGQPGDDAQAREASALAEFVNGLTGGKTYTSDDRGGGPIPPDFVPARIAWSSLVPLSSAVRGSDGNAPSPAQLGHIIRQFVTQPGQAPGIFVRQDGDRVLVSLAAIEHIIQQARPAAPQQPLPHPPHLPNFPYSHMQSMHGSMPPMHMQQRHSISSNHAPDMSPDLFTGLGGFEGE